ncbi:1-phosphatidylinositol 4-kinase [Sporobolomyces koalae]|uniref:1-phosphatidylinositol 4-kinase n=1 Tax=Sporobolomyces koalae TaxID=500713 RepID=UPI003171E707
MSLSESGGSGSALLLRLFESSFFDVHLAIGYLKTYPNSIGITHYLVNRLRSFEYEDVEFYWPQLIYLVITRPTDSVALENFLLERCEEDAHIATLWYLQASLSDLATAPNSEQFAVCRRILNRVQSIIFTEPPLPSTSPTSDATLPTTSSQSKTTSQAVNSSKPAPAKLNAPKSSFVGLGLLAAAFAMPGLVDAAGRMVLEQGRRIEQPSKADEPDEEEGDRNKEDSGSDEEKLVARGTQTPPATKSPPGSIKRSSRSHSSRSLKKSSNQPNYLPGARIEATPATLYATSSAASKPETTKSSSFFPNPFSLKSSNSSSTPSLQIGSNTVKPGASLGRAKSLRSPHPLASRNSSNNVPSISVPSLTLTSHSASNLASSSMSPSLSSQHLTGSSLPGYGLPKMFLSHLLLLQACRSQLDLVRSLQDISTRLVLVPKPARVSSLRAELTVLNHGLPRGCSLGMSTRPPPATAPPSGSNSMKPTLSVTAPPTSSSSTGSSSSSSSLTNPPRPTKPRRKQARVVRISPGESVVLNSADRAPFVVYVEVLEEDLDFDPDRRTNWEDLRRALKEREGLTSVGFASQYNQAKQVGRVSLESGLDGYAKGQSAANSRTNLNQSTKGTSTTNGFSPSPSPSATPTSSTPFAERAEFALGGSSESKGNSVIPNEGDLSAAPLEPEGEMDLVEQLYGDISLRDDSLLKLGDEAEDDEEEDIKNRDADELAWSRKEQEKAERRARRSSTVSSSASSVGGGGRTSISISNPNRESLTLDRTKPTTPTKSQLSTAPSGTTRPGGRSVQARQAISLDDYAERMRMAAIMLAQLDASQTAARGVVSAGTAAAGTLVGLPVATVAGVGGLVGAGLGAGLGAVKARLGGRREPTNGVGQASSGTKTNLDTASAAEGTSAVAGAPPLNAASAALSHSATDAQAATTTSGTLPATTTTAAPTQRARVLAPQDAAAIRERIMTEMLALEEERMERMRGSVQARKGWSKTSGLGGTTDNAIVMRAVNKDDPSGAVFAESFESKSARIRAASPFGHLPHWSLISCIVKTGADLRQEQLAVQLISEFGRIWKEENCPAWIYYFRILVTSENSGLIETITDSVSIHSIKKDAYARVAEDGTQVFASFTLADYFTDTYGAPSSPKYRKAQTAFIESLAAYSVISYLLQLKDRHNGNILLDRAGHLIHIDFGFMLSNSPGSLGFEMAPFKLPQDYIDILGGFDSPEFARFKDLFKRCFRDVRKHAERIITLVELMQKDSNLPCFANGDLTSQQLRERFVLSLTQAQVEDYAEKLILNSATSSFTKLYDLFQGYSNGIL